MTDERDGHDTDDVRQDQPTQTGGAGHDGTDPLFSESIPGYEIQREIGRGGMGVVYEAMQQHPHRRVAVKVVRGGRFVDKSRVKMFEREADTLARLKHPNIGGIYESGCTADGRHFFAMELVRGKTLDAYVKSRPPATSRDELWFRLSLFRQIADAVQYAHQRGVIHRDLKPSNIIVAGDGNRDVQIKILDFGLARMTEGDMAATITTEIGVIKGTLPYMSPEQARGNPEDVDLRADVYALGVILYELISGQRPYDVQGRSVVEAVRVICEQQPRSLRSLPSTSSGARRLDTDIETIVGKALEKEPDRRYASAAALSDDVGRYLTSQPILARPPSTSYQLRKFAARNRGLVGGIATTFVVLVAGVIVSTVLGLREASQRRVAEAARANLETVVAFQADMLSGVDPQRMGYLLMDDLRNRVADAAADRGASTGEIDRTVASLDGVIGTSTALRLIDDEILNRAAQALERDAALEPLIAARLHQTLGHTYHSLGLYDQAEPHLSRAVGIRTRELGDEHRDSLQSLSELEWLLVAQGRYDEVEPRMLETLEILRRVFGGEAPETLQKMIDLANLYGRTGRYDEAERLHRDALETRRRVLGEVSRDTASAMSLLANTLASQNRYDEAEQLYLEATDVLHELGLDDHPTMLVAMNNLATVYDEQARWDEAGRVYLEVLEARRRVLGDEHPGTLRTASNLAEVFRDQGRLDEAERLQRDTLEIRRRVLGDHHPDTLSSLTNLAQILDRLGRPDESEPLMRQVLAGRRKVIGSDHPHTVWTLMDLGILLSRQGRHDEAEPLLAEALQTYRRTLGDDHPDTLGVMSDLANERKSQGRHDEAELLYIESYEGFTRLGLPNVYIVSYNLSCLSAIRGHRPQALAWLREAVEGGFTDADWMLRDSELESLRGDPEFESIVALAREDGG